MTDLLSVDEAATYLRCSRRTLYSEHQRGRLAFVKVASRTRIRRAELDRYMKARTLGVDMVVT